MPAVGGSAVTFWIEVTPAGTFLPWKLPSGYSYQIVGQWGAWASTIPSSGAWITYADGTQLDTGATVPPGKLASAYTAQQVISAHFDNNGNALSGGSGQWNNPFTTHTPSQDVLVMLAMNSTDTTLSTVWVEVTVTPLGLWSHTFDFTSADGGFTPYVDGGHNRGLWTSGVGWCNNLADTAVPGDVYISKNFARAATLTAMDVTFATASTPGSGSSDNFAINNGTIDSGLTTLVHEVPMPSGSPHTTHWSGSQAVTASNGIEFYFDPIITASGCSMQLQKIVISGTGVDPF